MSTVSFSSQTINVSNPLVPLARAQLVVGAIATLAAGWGLARIQPVMSSLFLTRQSSAGQVGLLLLFGFACAVWLLWGLLNIWHGLRGLGPRMIVPPRTPIDLGEPRQPKVGLDLVENVLVRQEFPHLRVPKRGPLAWIQRFLRDRVLFGTPREFRLLAESIRWGKRAFVLAGLAAVVVFLGLSRVQGGMPSGGNGLFIGIGLAIVAAATIRGMAIPMLLPKAAPIANRDEHTRTVRGGGDPASLQPMVWQEFLRLREGEIPNRDAREIVTTLGTVADTGEYTARMWVETQPLAEAPSASPLTWLYLGGAVGCTAVGMLLAVLGLLTGTFTSVIINTLIALAWTYVGNGLLKSGFIHLSRFRYTSTLAFMLAEGTIGRSEIKAGKGWNDSFESANLVVRSDSTMRLYSASLVTETYLVEGPRFILWADRDSKSEQAMQLLNRVVDAYERAGIVVRPIESNDSGLNQMAQANLAFRQASTLVAGGAASPPGLEESSGAAPPFQLLTSSAAAPSAQSGDTKVCPMCAETVKAAAIKCRFCGHLFEA